MSRKRLGELLTDLGLIDESLLRTALAKQRAWNKRLGETLVQMGVLSDRQLAGVLSGQLNMPAVDLGARTIDPRLARHLGEEFCRRNECLPFAYHEKGRFLDLAMGNPLNLEVFEQIRVRMQCNPRPYVVGPVALRDAICAVFGTSGAEERLPSAEFEEVGITGELLLELGSQDKLQAVQPGLDMPSVDIDIDEPSVAVAKATVRAADPQPAAVTELRDDIRELRQVLAQTNRRLDYLVKLIETAAAQGTIPRGRAS